jgi:hypothetical protein
VPLPDQARKNSYGLKQNRNADNVEYHGNTSGKNTQVFRSQSPGFENKAYEIAASPDEQKLT